MAWKAFGLRSKSVLALVLACALALVPTGLVGWQLMEGVREHFGEAYARNFTELNTQRMLAPVLRDLALSRRLADSEVTRRWLQDEADPDSRSLFFREAEGYRSDFRDGSYFLISADSRNYYFNDSARTRRTPRYRLDPDSPADAWFFNTMADDVAYNINVNPDEQLGTTRVWLNVVVKDGERRIGLAGTGLDLDGFLDEFINTDEPGVTPMVLDANGLIQAHPDESLITFGSTTGAIGSAHTLEQLLDGVEGRQRLLQVMQQGVNAPGEVRSFRAALGGREQLFALAYVPELRWHVVTAVDLNVAQVLDRDWARLALAALTMLIVALLAGFGYAVDRVVLRPVRRLQHSATAISHGHYDVLLPGDSRDEIGDLSAAFGRMADQVQRHTEELETKVRERTAALERSNREMKAAQRQISASIDYASLIQRAILPDRQMSQMLGKHHAVLWRPRDVVGGDFYVFRCDAQHYLVGVVDCAGHGVPGALMTMLARAAIDQAVDQAGMLSPAMVLRRADEAMRAMLQDFSLPRAIATNMDAGVVCVDRSSGTLRYAGAKISLYWSDGECVEEIKGGRRALGHRRKGSYEDTELPLRRGGTYYLATDGYLDQAGGELGYGFGNSRFARLLREHARLPVREQIDAFGRVLDRYRGGLPQRDDVTILSFRID